MAEKNTDKKVDEAYKESVAKEKKATEDASTEQTQKPEADFTMFVTGLAMQAFMALGLMPDPQSKQVNKNLTNAKYLIDSLSMLQEKTSGNLNTDETKIIEDLLYDLRIAFIEITKNNEASSDTNKES